jgi:hypothetical protein
MGWRGEAMKFFDVGPEPIQVTGYFGKERRRPASPGGVQEVSTVEEFYKETRARACRWVYSVSCVAAPGAVLGLALLFIHHDFPKLLTLGPPLTASVERFCDLPFSGRPLANVVTASALHFAVTHIVLLTACLLAFAFAAWAIRNVLAIHVLSPKLPKLSRGAANIISFGMLPAVGGMLFAIGVAVFFAAEACFGKDVRTLFGSGAAFDQWIPDTRMPCLGDVLGAAGTLDAQAHWGVLAVTLSGVALALAAGTIAFRFERGDIDGYWADSYVLRHKLKALLTLFLFASVVLVVTNIALSSYTDFAANVFGEIQASGVACFPTAIANAQPELVTPHCRKSEAAAQTTNAGADEAKKSGPAQSAREPPKPPDAITELFAQANSLRKTLLNLAGGLASLTLVAMFLPAFAGLTSDIEIAGKTHAEAGAQPADVPAKKQGPELDGTPKVKPDAPDGIKFVVAIGEAALPVPPKFKVAGWKAVNAWKDAHGLSLEFSDVATTLAAAAAPLLSNGVFDLSKSLLGVS